MTSAKIPFFRNDVTHNKYVWIALASCIVIVAITYLIPIMRTVMGVSEMGAVDWLNCIGFSFLSVVIIQICKRVRLIL